MKQPNVQARLDYLDIVEDKPIEITIPRTKKTVKVRGIRPYTLERLTRLWLERDEFTIKEESAATLKDMCIDPYFAAKEAALIVLNDYWKIRLFWWFMWRYWGKWKGYAEEQMSPIIEAGKKKLPLMAHWTNMAFSVDMRTDWMKMTRKEAEEYRAELLSVASRLSSKNTQATEGQEGSSSDL